MLKVDKLAVCYGTQTVVDQVSFSLEAGQWLMLCGPNGAGKSTLVRAVTACVPFCGSALLEGRDVRRMRPAQLAHRIGVLSQHSHAQYAFTVEDVVRMGRYAQARGFLSRSDPEGEAKVNAALDAVGMTALRHHEITTLSGGEMQRAFLAQVFAQDPELLILDEPANHLDVTYQKQIFDLIGAWLCTPGRAVMSVVHDLNLARRYGTHTLLMHKGRCVAQGSTGSVLTRSNLEAVYHMDVLSWMRDMLGQWGDEGDEGDDEAGGGFSEKSPSRTLQKSEILGGA